VACKPDPVVKSRTQAASQLDAIAMKIEQELDLDLELDQEEEDASVEQRVEALRADMVSAEEFP